MSETLSEYLLIGTSYEGALVGGGAPTALILTEESVCIGAGEGGGSFGGSGLSGAGSEIVGGFLSSSSTPMFGLPTPKSGSETLGGVKSGVAAGGD